MLQKEASKRLLHGLTSTTSYEIASTRLCILLIAGIFRRYNARQADGLSPSPNP